ncbi:MAG: SHOCT domain-containing protein [Planctomycetaceae bacterium]|nr:SHOCT domain-containing protein [Planctomycetales bacterium]MCB9926622.1 SHOCT domain-containing protein [Planctomycetaceae bacterium]
MSAVAPDLLESPVVGANAGANGIGVPPSVPVNLAAMRSRFVSSSSDRPTLPGGLNYLPRPQVANHHYLLSNQLFEYRWLDLHDAHVSEGVMFADFSVVSVRGSRVSIGYLPKAQARRIYRIAQQREEEMIELRRLRQMEESRAGANNIVVNSPIQQQPVVASDGTTHQAHNDPLARLTKLKQMLEAGLIEQEEFNATKAKILSEM